jgi:mono/diheme cytochrome c family protein
MNHMFRFALLVPLFAFSLAQIQAQDLPEGKGKDVVMDVCTACHGADVIASQKATRQAWQSIVDDMVSRGADADAAKIKVIVDYLATYLGKEGGDTDKGKEGGATDKGGSAPGKDNGDKAAVKQLKSAPALAATQPGAVARYR